MSPSQAVRNLPPNYLLSLGLTFLCLTSACSKSKDAPAYTGHNSEASEAFNENSDPEVRSNLKRCQKTPLVATAFLSLKKATSYNLSRLVADPQIVTTNGVSMRVVEFKTTPVRVGWNGREEMGIRVDCSVELQAPSDAKLDRYSATVRLPRAYELSYWGGFTQPTFQFIGKFEKLPPTVDASACPTASLPPSSVPPQAQPEKPDGFFREAWRIARGFTKSEALQAALLLPFIAYLSHRGTRYFQTWVKAILTITFFTSILFALLAWIRLLFIWP